MNEAGKGWTLRAALVCAAWMASALLGSPAYADGVTYTYDALGRVTGAAYSSGGQVTYAYDAASNRTQQTFTSGSGGNQNPVANPDSLTTVGSAVTFDPRVNDTDINGDALTITGISSAPSKGSASYTGTSITYTPTVGQTLGDSLGYTISDGHGGTATGTVNITLYPPVTNGAPVAVNDTVYIVMPNPHPGTPFTPTITFDPRVNDSDPDYDPLTITAKTNGTGGTVSIYSGSIYSLTYTYNTSTTGTLSATDSFTYTISDGTHTSTATVNVVINIT